MGAFAADLREALPRTVVKDRPRPTRLEDPPTVVTEPAAGRRTGRPVLLALICLLVLTAAFAASYAVTAVLR